MTLLKSGMPLITGGLGERGGRSELLQEYYHPPLRTVRDEYRSAVVEGQSQALSLAALPDPEPVRGNTVVLTGAVQPMEPGRLLLLTGSPLVFRITGERVQVLQTSSARARLQRGDLLQITGSPVNAIVGDRALFSWPVITLSGVAGWLDGPEWICLDAASALEAFPMHKTELLVLTDFQLTADRQHSSLSFKTAMVRRYYRSSVVLYGNVVRASHGESRGPIVLGSGEGNRVDQHFQLPEGPLTYLAGASGQLPQLQVQVGGAPWQRVPSFYRQSARERSFVLSLSDNQTASVRFGDGFHGARLPMGVDNVTACFRIGLGRAGNVAAGSITQTLAVPFGVTDVTNPLPAGGGADPEETTSARGNIPLHVTNLDRIVSLQDYQTFAMGYPGIAKALAERMMIEGVPILGLPGRRHG